MRPINIVFAGLCAASIGCADVVCPEGRVEVGWMCRCEEGTMASGEADGHCVPAIPQPVSIDAGGLDAGGLDASLSAATGLPCVGDAGCRDAGAAPDASTPDASR